MNRKKKTKKKQNNHIFIMRIPLGTLTLLLNSKSCKLLKINAFTSVAYLKKISKKSIAEAALHRCF